MRYVTYNLEETIQWFLQNDCTYDYNVMKRQVLESATIPGVDIAQMSWTEDADLMRWLAQLGRYAALECLLD